MKLYHAIAEELDIKDIDFKKNIDIIEYIDDIYCGKMKKIIFIAMIGEDANDYYITDSYLKIQDFFKNSLPNKKYYLFEQKTYEEAFEFCKIHSEDHELANS